eukprot:COSAG03_NODE_2253_length_2956_cov_10.344067_2_plen_57_part_00
MGGTEQNRLWKLATGAQTESEGEGEGEGEGEIPALQSLKRRSRGVGGDWLWVLGRG